ncbi:tetratricopeptide repeat protein [Neotamlana laminarinivorans]|uniref:Tetratricopeptide repeat protein n=1 Tax=Neotamlana laminarinivorans TaxID=2883124 RepID=A0A9X1L5B6_9FLAO|nr:tetratricopeptide repeat protein [Tamlana laminarinivorans]MCB4799211.1 tetratricopeptide repeat protein [Tamlana laminarinivorans]
MKKFILLLLFPLSIFAQINKAEIDLLFKNKQYQKAENILKFYVKNNPKNLEAIELLGDAYGYQEQWDNAINTYKTLVNVKPNIANYQYKYGGAMGMKALENKFKAISFVGDIKSAFIKAAELDKNHINARWALVELYVQLPGIIGGSITKALKYAQELEKLSKVDGYLAKGYIYEYDDEPELAEKFYKQAIKQGGSLVCFDKLTKFYEKTNKPEQAIKNIESAHQKHQRNALHYQIGKVAAEYNVELQKGEKCLKVYIKNYSAEDGVPKAWANYRLAQIYYHKQNKTEALKHIDLALKELPKIQVFKNKKQKILNL